MIGAEWRRGLHPTIAGVKHSDRGRFRLGINEILDVAELIADRFYAGGIVDYDGELQTGLVTLRGSEAGDGPFIFALENADVIHAEGRRWSVFGSERGDDRGDRNCTLSMRWNKRGDGQNESQKYSKFPKCSVHKTLL